MKYLGLIVDDKDIATKEYVDEHTQRYKYRVDYTPTGTSTRWAMNFPYDSSYTAEQLNNCRAYYVSADGEKTAEAYWHRTYRVTAPSSGYDVWRTECHFQSGACPAAGDTITFENDCTDDVTIFIVH